MLTRTLARELAPAVRANAVMPGVIETRHHEVFSTPAKMQEYRGQTPMGRNGSAEEVAQAILGRNELHTGHGEPFGPFVAQRHPRTQRRDQGRVWRRRDESGIRRREDGDGVER